MKFILSRNEATKFWRDRFKNSIMMINATSTKVDDKTTIHESVDYILKITRNDSRTEIQYEILHK